MNDLEKIKLETAIYWVMDKDNDITFSRGYVIDNKIKINVAHVYDCQGKFLCVELFCFEGCEPYCKIYNSTVDIQYDVFKHYCEYVYEQLLEARH
jgi:hypothetical protein